MLRSFFVSWLVLFSINALSLSEGSAQQPSGDAERIFTDNILRSIIQLTRLENIVLKPCGGREDYSMGVSAPTFTEELVVATRAGTKVVVIDGFSGERIENHLPQLDYWFSKVSIAAGDVKLKDVTPNQSFAAGAIDWVLTTYGKDLVASVTSAISSAAARIYEVAADEYISAGIARYDATVEYWRAAQDLPGRGIIQRVLFACKR
jgi:hypothetical protein